MGTVDKREGARGNAAHSVIVDVQDVRIKMRTVTAQVVTVLRQE